MTKYSFRGLSLGACLAMLLSTASAVAALYAPIEDAELLRRSETVVLARAGTSTVVAGQSGLPETRTAFDVLEALTGPESSFVEVAVPGGELPGGPGLALDGVPRFSPGAIYVLALRTRGDGMMVPAELGLGVFDVVRDEAGRQYATRAMFRSELVATRFREADGSLVERPEPLRDLAGFTSWVRAGAFREAALPGVPAWIVARETGGLTQVKKGGVTAMWDDHWCPSGVPGSCGSNFVRYRWVEPKASVRWCDEDPSTNGQGAVLMGGTAQFRNAADLWTNDAGSNVAYTVDAPMTGTCNPAAIPAAGTVAAYLDDVSMFGGQPFPCPFEDGGVVGLGGVVTDGTVHVWKGTEYRTIRAGIAWLRRAGPTCRPGDYVSDLYQAVVANVLGATLGLTAADRSSNPNDLDPSDDRFALMRSVYETVPWPVLGDDDREALCYLYGSCVGLPPEASLFVPFVGRVAGVSGATFSSEMALTNRSSVTSNVLIEYTPALGLGKGTVTEIVGAGRQLIVPDVITYLRERGLAISETGDAAGTLRVTFGGVYAHDAAVTVRTTTPVIPGVSPPIGRAGLAYLGVPVDGLLLGPAWLLGLRQSPGDRSNVAFQHAGVEADGPIRIRATWYSAAGVPGSAPVERTLSPGGWTQFDLATLEPTATQGYVKVDLVQGRAPWYAYGVVNDALTSDGSFIAPIPDSTLKAQESLVLPVAVEAGPYATEIILDNVSETPKRVRLKWVADGLAQTWTTVEYPLAPGQQQVIPDWVEALRSAGDHGVPAKGARLTGAIFVSVVDGTVSGISISARVLNQAPAPVAATRAESTGLFGVHYPAITAPCLANQAAWLGGLRQDEENRTNIAIINTGEVDASSATYLVEIFDGDLGTKAGETLVEQLPWERFKQVDRAISQIAPGVRNAYARITVVSGPNPFIAYAVVNDGAEPGRRSGDGAYIPSEIVPVQ